MKLFHVSYKYIGKEFTLFPRVPKNRAPDEPERPKRVCVSPRIGDALCLFPWSDGQHKCSVYVTDVKYVSRQGWSLPKKYVPDYKKYGREEVWLLNKRGYFFKYLGYVRMFRLDLIYGRPFWYFKRGGEGYAATVVDPTLLADDQVKKQVDEELRCHKEMRSFIRDIKANGMPEAKPRLAKYADDVWIADQIGKGEKPYRVPLKGVSCVK